MKKLFTIGTGPRGDWQIIFFSVLVLTLVLIAVDVSLFLSTKSSTATEADVTSSTLNIALLKKTNAYYANKRSTFANILSGTSTPADPSL